MAGADDDGADDAAIPGDADESGDVLETSFLLMDLPPEVVASILLKLTSPSDVCNLAGASHACRCGAGTGGGGGG